MGEVINKHGRRMDRHGQVPEDCVEATLLEANFHEGTPIPVRFPFTSSHKSSFYSRNLRHLRPHSHLEYSHKFLSQHAPFLRCWQPWQHSVLLPRSSHCYPPREVGMRRVSVSLPITRPLSNSVHNVNPPPAQVARGSGHSRRSSQSSLPYRIGNQIVSEY